jgi:hypothetical protein
VPAAVGASVLNDTDNLLDYYLWYVEKDPMGLYLLLHACEYCAAAAIFVLMAGNHPVLLAAAVANVGHLLGDYITHKPNRPLTYSLLYRAAVLFERVRLAGGSPPSLTIALYRNISCEVTSRYDCLRSCCSICA